jgi:hypothetical protein
VLAGQDVFTNPSQSQVQAQESKSNSASSSSANANNNNQIIINDNIQSGERHHK